LEAPFRHRAQTLLGWFWRVIGRADLHDYCRRSRRGLWARDGVLPADDLKCVREADDGGANGGYVDAQRPYDANDRIEQEFGLDGSDAAGARP
jgi:hypothetical protein